MPEIIVNVRGKLAEPAGAPEIVCGNGDYIVRFVLDEEWQGETGKTARFRFLRRGVPCCADVPLVAGTAAVPVLDNTTLVEAGLFSSRRMTTTPARIPCRPCITDGPQPEPFAPEPGLLDSLLEQLHTLRDLDLLRIGDARPRSAGLCVCHIGAPETEETE